jgi:hypothetical protein
MSALGLDGGVLAGVVVSAISADLSTIGGEGGRL